MLGPTAVGKSDLVYSDFREARVHVISADSMQVYRGFDVATATPDTEDLEAFPHTGINSRDPDESYSVEEFLTEADEAVETARGNDRTPVVLGGTALYLKAFLYGLDDMPEKNPEYRRKLRDEARENPDGYLHERLRAIDPQAADNIHPNDTKRVIRALEIHHETGRTKTELTSGEQTLREHLDASVIGLRRPREELKQRIRRRIKRMLNDGLIEEVRLLKEEGPVSKTLRQAIGYDSVSKYLEGALEMDEVQDRMFKRTKELARKQMSWFRKFPVDEWFHPENDKKELIATVGNKLDRHERV